MAKQPRFIEAYTQGIVNKTQVLIDTATGVNYIFHTDGQSGGMCVLVDAAGQPIVTPLELLPQYVPQ